MKSRWGVVDDSSSDEQTPPKRRQYGKPQNAKKEFNYKNLPTKIKPEEPKKKKAWGTVDSSSSENEEPKNSKKAKSWGKFDSESEKTKNDSTKKHKSTWGKEDSEKEEKSKNKFSRKKHEKIDEKSQKDDSATEYAQSRPMNGGWGRNQDQQNIFYNENSVQQTQTPNMDRLPPFMGGVTDFDSIPEATPVKSRAEMEIESWETGGKPETGEDWTILTNVYGGGYSKAEEIQVAGIAARKGRKFFFRKK